MLLCEAAQCCYFTSKKGVHCKRLQCPVEAIQVDQALMTRTVKSEHRVLLDVENHGHWCSILKLPQAEYSKFGHQSECSGTNRILISTLYTLCKTRKC